MTIAAILPDHAALAHLVRHGGALCTLVAIEGSYSRKLGAQLALDPAGGTGGDLADHCLEEELRSLVRQAGSEGRAPTIRFGAGAEFADFRLPCGSAIDVLIDPTPDLAAARRVLANLEARQRASLALPASDPKHLQQRHYAPTPRLVTFGHSAEADALAELAPFYGMSAIDATPRGLSASTIDAPVDAWTAIVSLTHDHEWERLVLPWALRSDAFLIGAMGGANARDARVIMLEEVGFSADDIARVAEPVGLFPSARNARALALSVTSQIVARYEELWG